MKKRIVCISDTHEQHAKLSIPEADILIHAGDITYEGRLDKILQFNEWLGTLPIPNKVIIAGNHDWLFYNEPSFSRTVITNATYLDEEETEIDGVRIFGSPWQPEFFSWAFNAKRGDEIQKHWDLIPEDIHVLVTHGPPRNILDLSSRRIACGCDNLLNTIKNRLKNLKLHVFGHVHEGYGEKDEDGVHYINASSCNARYEPVNKPIVYDLEI